MNAVCSRCKAHPAITTFDLLPVCSNCVADLLQAVFGEAKGKKIEELSYQFMAASQETHPDLPDGCEW